MPNETPHCLPPSPTLQTVVYASLLVFSTLKLVVKLTLSSSVVQAESL